MLTAAEKKTKQMLNTQVIVELPMEQIVENPDNERLFGMDNIDKLADTIEDEGFTGAIEVIKIGDDKYEISAGHRRYAAMKELGKATIPAIIIPNKNEADKAKHLLSSNINNREITPLMYSRMIPYYVEKVLKPSNFKGDKRKELARFFGMSEAQIQRFTRLSKLIPELQKLTENPQFPWSRIMKAAYQEEEVQYEIYDEIKKYMAEYPEEYNSHKIEMICDLVVSRVERRKKQAEIEAQQRESEEQKISTQAAEFPINPPISEPTIERVTEAYENSSHEASATKDENRNYAEETDKTEEEVRFENNMNHGMIKGLRAQELDLPVVKSTSTIHAENLIQTAIEQTKRAVELPIQNREELKELIEELSELLDQLKTLC